MARTRTPAKRTTSSSTALARADSSSAVARGIPGVKRKDGWQNFLTGLGTARDKRTATSILYNRLSYVECEDYWRGSDMAAKMVEEPAREMTRRWLDVQIEPSKEEEQQDQDVAKT